MCCSFVAIPKFDYVVGSYLEVVRPQTIATPPPPLLCLPIVTCRTVARSSLFAERRERDMGGKQSHALCGYEEHV